MQYSYVDGLEFESWPGKRPFFTKNSKIGGKIQMALIISFERRLAHQITFFLRHLLYIMFSNIDFNRAHIIQIFSELVSDESKQKAENTSWNVIFNTLRFLKLRKSFEMKIHLNVLIQFYSFQQQLH